jgi:amino acid adenylation domain-containing protein/thioester reductase-like protein
MAETASYWVRNLIKMQRQIPKIVPSPRESKIPLTFAQQRVWFVELLAPASTAYHMASVMRFKGFVDRPALESSLNSVIQRHEILRTVFAMEEGQPYQKILPDLNINIEYGDFQTLEDDRENTAFEWITQIARRPFSLTDGPLLACAFAQIDGKNGILLFVVHHIIMDGWSTRIFFNEIFALYNAHLTGREIRLAEPPLQYADYAYWQRSPYLKSIFASQLAYWKQKLQNASFILELPADHPRPAAATFKGKVIRVHIGSDIVKSLKKLRAVEKGVSLYMILLAALRVLLFRYSGQEDIVIGSPLANRNRREVQDLMGFIANIVVLYTNLSGDPSFSELLKKECQTCLEAYENQDLPFEYLVNELQLTRDPSRNPIFQISFSYQNVNVFEEEARIEKAVLKSTGLQREGSMFDLTLYLYDRGKELDGWLEYNTALFDDATMERFIGHYINLLKFVGNSPETKISRIRLLSAEEYYRIMTEWNDTAVNYSRHLGIHQLFEAQVERNPAALAVVCDGMELTYNELNRRANQLANYLKKLGVQEHMVVGICMERSCDLIIGLLAILKAGGAYLPLESTYPSERLKYMLEDSKAGMVLTQTSLIHKLPFEFPQKLVLDTERTQFQNESQLNLKLNLLSECLAYIIYTSGTTGEPKGVMIRHRSVINFIEWANRTFGINERDRGLFVTSPCFDLSVYDIFGLLAGGGTVHIPTENSLKDPEKLVEILCMAPVTFWHSAPAALQQLLPFLSTLKSGWRTDNLRLVLVGGDWIGVNLPDAIVKTFTGAKIVSMGGVTEATIWQSFYPIDCVDPEWASIPYGKPLQNCKLHILDQNRHPCPIGVPGDLYVGGECLAVGYTKPEFTREKFIPDPFSKRPGDRLYFTGDKARYRPDGNIEFLGRNDSQVKIRGFRIELEEIQTVIRKHAEVSEAVVIAREIKPGDKRLVAYYVPGADSQLSAGELREFLRNKLPGYMIPSFFIKLGALPLSPNGKVNYQSLRSHDYESELADEYEEARTQVEKRLAQICSRELEVEKVGLKSNFFELGGNSLLAVQVLTEINRSFGIELSVREFLEAGTIGRLAGLIEGIVRADGASGADSFDLEKEVYLEPEIWAADQEISVKDGPENVLLTGATGSLGSFLLYELLERTDVSIYCLVRATDEKEAADRIRTVLQSKMLWKDANAGRIIPVTGDLSKEKLGIAAGQFVSLTKKIDTIFHCGALVNFIQPYQVLKPVNVAGIREIFKFAVQNGVKTVNYISTLSVFVAGDGGRKVFNEADELTYRQELLKESGYVQSKWVAEKIASLARDRGLPVNVYRMGIISGDSKTGIGEINDFLWLLVKVCIELKTAPRFPMDDLEMTPVDYISKAIVTIAGNKRAINKNYHIVNSNLFTWQMLINRLREFGYALDMVDFKTWREMVGQHYESAKDPYLSVLLHIFSQAETASAIFPKATGFNTMEQLRDTRLVCPEISGELLKTYISYFVKEGLMNSPIGTAWHHGA